jgi:hypothetical protein
MIVLYIIAGIIAALLIVALFIPNGMKATREIVINKPNAEVFNYIRHLKNHDNFSKWATMDPKMKKEFRGIDGTVGFINAWEGNKKVGKGEQEIKGIEDGKKIDFELRFEKPFKSVAKAVMTTEAADINSTKVVWGFEGSMNYPMNVIKLFMNIEKAMGDDFATGLSNLKRILEK